jgi:hypothetical protein
MYDRLDAEWRCLLCGRARRRKAAASLSEEPARPAFRRKWEVAPEELRFDCGG